MVQAHNFPDWDEFLFLFFIWMSRLEISYELVAFLTSVNEGDLHLRDELSLSRPFSTLMLFAGHRIRGVINNLALFQGFTP